MSSKDEDRLGSDARLAISTATEALKTAASNMKDLSKTLAGMNQGAHEINETVMATIDAKLGLTSALCKVQEIQSAIDRASAVVAASASDEQAITTADANPRSEQEDSPHSIPSPTSPRNGSTQTDEEWHTSSPSLQSSHSPSAMSTASSHTFPEAPFVFRVNDTNPERPSTWLQGSWVSKFESRSVKAGPLQGKELFVEIPAHEPAPRSVKAIRFEPPSKDVLVRIAGKKSHWIIVTGHQASKEGADEDEEVEAQRKRWYEEFLANFKGGVDSEKVSSNENGQEKEDQKSAEDEEDEDEEGSKDTIMQAA